MHHTDTKNLGWNHNGDFDGEVKVTVPASAVDGPWPDGTYVIEIPFEDIKELVAEYVRKEFIRMAEEATPDELLHIDEGF
jgi:hypothetical protein